VGVRFVMVLLVVSEVGSSLWWGFRFVVVLMNRFGGGEGKNFGVIVCLVEILLDCFGVAKGKSLWRSFRLVVVLLDRFGGSEGGKALWWVFVLRWF